MEYKFTEEGKKNAENYLTNLMAKRKEILDAGLDTVEEADCANLTIDSLLEDAVNTGFDEDMQAINGYYVTDNYDSDNPYCFELGKDIVKVPESEKELYNAVVEDYRNSDGEFSSEYFVPYMSENLAEGDILSAYIELQHDLNGDYVIKVDSRSITIYDDDEERLSFLTADVLKFKKEDYPKIYKGNIEQFLKSFNNREKETGLCRVDGYNMADMKVEQEELFDFIF